MQSDLKALKIGEGELENLSGLDVNDIFIGGIFGGTYRPSVWRDSKKLFFFCLTEVSVFVLILVFTLPVGFILTQNPAQVGGEIQQALQFFVINLSVAFILMLGWNFYLWSKQKGLASLANLLDEVDKYNEVIKAVEIIDKLAAIGHLPANLINRDEVLEALRVTRESLVCALMTEKILRQHKSFIARRHELFTNIENNLLTLRTLEVNSQASEYGRLLNEAIQIGMSVYKEVKKLQN
ncbi:MULTISPECIES: hypothetical protein [Trichocoleus]|uniref:Uncharacterized protein n=1 Tax=Trichocoleus desertorum GB2-A4 TaxID=2933944 RepID=A0ABV0J4Q3_9CYAN|nr:hypothetical protein [Trichocoleus sp. FACHB-46]MBD1863597.1 hypothetical protein [Trichocoleus sp. FACHB-46]